MEQTIRQCIACINNFVIWAPREAKKHTCATESRYTGFRMKFTTLNKSPYFAYSPIIWQIQKGVNTKKENLHEGIAVGGRLVPCVTTCFFSVRWRHVSLGNSKSLRSNKLRHCQDIKRTKYLYVHQFLCFKSQQLDFLDLWGSLLNLPLELPKHLEYLLRLIENVK